MLRLAIKTYSFRFEPKEINTVDTALRSLEKLGSLRNEIAHGHVSSYSEHIDGVVTASGNYLLPSLSERQHHEREFRFHHAPKSLQDFTAKVRHWRWKIVEVDMALGQRTQQRVNFGMHTFSLMDAIRRIARVELHGYEAVDEMRRIMSYFDPTSDRHKGGEP